MAKGRYEKGKVETEIKNRFSEEIERNMVQERAMPRTVDKRRDKSLKESQVKVGFPPHPVRTTTATESITLLGRISKFLDALERGEGEKRMSMSREEHLMQTERI